MKWSRIIVGDYSGFFVYDRGPLLGHKQDCSRIDVRFMTKYFFLIEKVQWRASP